MNHALAIDRLYKAAAELGYKPGGGVVLRPSNAGYCPARLWWTIRQPDLDVRDPKREWAPLQGTYNEALMKLLLRVAGAEVIDPPHLADDIKPHPEFQDPETGMTPHTDGLLRWPEVLGHSEWVFLELKFQRAQAQIGLFDAGLYNDRTYWYQGVSYLSLGQLVMDLYAELEAEESWGDPGPWQILQDQGVLPRELVFFSTAKDGSTARMLWGGRTKQTIKELTTPEKMKPEDILRAENKVRMRQRLEDLGGSLDFYLEVVHKDEPEVQQTWEDIRQLPVLMRGDGPPEPLHDSTLAEDDLDVECAAYCPVLFECREWAQKRQFEMTEEFLQQFTKKENPNYDD